MTAPVLHFLRPRIYDRSRETSLSVFTLPTFWVLQAGNISQALGYYVPWAYMSAYATTIGLTPEMGALLIALLNGASVPGSLIIGILNDRFDVSNTILLSTVGSTIAVFIFWGLAGHIPLLAMFTLLYGFFAGGFSSTWSGTLKQMKREKPAIDTGFAYGLLGGVRGLGNVISGPVSSALVGKDMGMNARFGYETKYEWLIVFTGLMAFLSGWGWIWKEYKRVRS